MAEMSVSGEEDETKLANSSVPIRHISAFCGPLDGKSPKRDAPQLNRVKLPRELQVRFAGRLELGSCFEASWSLVKFHLKLVRNPGHVLPPATSRCGVAPTPSASP